MVSTCLLEANARGKRYQFAIAKRTKGTLTRKKFLPDFFLLGAAKCATTSLYCYLKQHPELYLPDHKEPHVLNSPKEEFRRELDDYRVLYEPAESQVSCDGTPSYFRDADVVIPRMKELYGSHNPKFVLLFRDPVERAFSHYLHKRRAGVVPDTFEDALEWEENHPDRSHEEWKSYFQDGLYADRLAMWQEHFPEAHFHVLLLDDLRRDAQTAVQRVFRFLGVDPDVEVDTSHQYNQHRDIRYKWIRNFMRAPSSGMRSVVTAVLPRDLRRLIRRTIHSWNQQSVDEKPELSSSTECRLRREYQGSVDRLEDMIDRDLSAWYPESGGG